MSSTDRIEKDVVLSAPRSRVWAAVGDSTEFGKWFKCRFDGPFEEGKTIRATLLEPGWEGTPFLAFVERVEPGRHLSFRWHVHDVDLDADYSGEPTTLVSFDLEDHPEGTRLRIVESGFDAVPGDLGSEARERNAEGWTIQAKRIADHVDEAA